jgi:hypothetical protein
VEYQAPPLDDRPIIEVLRRRTRSRSAKRTAAPWRMKGVRLGLALAAFFFAACSAINPSPPSREPSPLPGATGTPVASQPGPTLRSPAQPSIGPLPSAAAKPCPVTTGNGKTPPGEAQSTLNFGNGRLWTVLWPNGLVFVPPDDIGPDGSLGMKFPWWRGPDVHGALHIQGHELTLGLPVRAEISNSYGDTGFQASGIIFPIDGCYEIVGEAGGVELTFVTLVRPCSALVELAPSLRANYAISGR